MKKKPQTESEACKNMIFYLKNTKGYKMDFFKGMNINETLAQKAAKRRKLSEEAQEAEDLRKRLEIVEDEDDDVFVEATPFSQKVLVVDYQIVVIDNKHRYKIIKADDTHQLYISFTTLLKNFDREDLETLWRIVRDRFSTSKSTNFSDEYLLLTLKTMFKEPDGQDPIWRNQKSVHGLALVKRWKLLTSCGVHVITLLTVQLFLLVERRYPLSRFTLEQLVNVARLRVEEESEMSLELLSPIPQTRIHSIHPTTQILRDPNSAVQTRSKVNKTLEDESWVDAIQEELLKFKTQQVWILVDLPFRKKRHRQEEGIDYDEVFAPVARIKAIRIFLAFASYIGFIVYQMDVKSAFLYGKINEEVYVSQPPGFIDSKFPKKVYKVVKALYGLHQAPKAWYSTLSTFLVENRYIREIINKTLFIKKDQKDIMLREDGIFISQDKYVAKILKKFDFISVKTASTPIETKKPLVKDAEAADVDVHLYRSMIGSLMYLNASRPDIMYAVCACSRFQVTPKTLHLQAVKRIFRKSTTGGEDKKAKTGLYIEEGSFNKLDDLVGECVDYTVNKGRSTDKIKALNAKVEGVSDAGETLSTATLAVSTVSVQSVLVLLKLLCLIGSKDR
nr:hypothetical protein [Tanacetum cinerariifolium]